MSAFSDYLEDNRELAYSLAEANTIRNTEGRVVISKDDEWRDEKEWDRLYVEMKTT